MPANPSDERIGPGLIWLTISLSGAFTAQKNAVQESKLLKVQIYKSFPVRGFSFSLQ